ncbi:MAG: hypothetical protein KatS3mg101_0909 [Patescibacteria group bacterium]|nr:MAG: hypothetical protein KatS3mg101_0909 [Patescibacteria group bacterium]
MVYTTRFLQTFFKKIRYKTHVIQQGLIGPRDTLDYQTDLDQVSRRSTFDKPFLKQSFKNNFDFILLVINFDQKTSKTYFFIPLSPVVKSMFL